MTTVLRTFLEELTSLDGELFLVAVVVVLSLADPKQITFLGLGGVTRFMGE